MSRQFKSNSRARQPQLSSIRGPRMKEHPDETYQEGVPKKRKGGSKYGATMSKSKRAKKLPAKVSDVESTTAGESSADEADEEADDESDDVEQPAFKAPSRAPRLRGTGRYQYDQSDDNLSEAGESDGFPMFEDDGIAQSHVEKDVELEAMVFASGDEEIYQGVEDISDSDDNEEDVEKVEECYLKEEFLMGTGDDSEDPSFYLNQIDGMSAYGFGEESDGTVQFAGDSQSSDDAAETLQRRVRFEDAVPDLRSAFMRLSDSPTMARALLPSALPNTFTSTLSAAQNRSPTPDESDDYDSDATDDALPPEAIRNLIRAPQPEVEEEEEKSHPWPAGTPKKTPRRGPPTGTFIDDGVKSAGILDPSGTMLIITNPHLLGEEFARRYGPSQPASPSLGFAEAVLEGANDSQASENGDIVNSQPADLMLSSLNSSVNTTFDGQATGPPEAFFAAAGFDPDDYDVTLGFVEGDFNGSDFGEMDDAEKFMKIEDVIDFDSDSDNDSLTSPIYMPSELSILGNSNELAHLNNNNVTAFRRNADPAYAAQIHEPTALRHGQFNTPKVRRKRKAENDSPYNHSHYKGVTPVQRMRDPNHGNRMMSSPIPESLSKRRKIMT